VPATLAGLRLAGALQWFWWLGGHIGEGRRWLTEVLDWDTGDDGRAAYARALFADGMLAMIQGDYQQAHDLLDRGAALAEALGDQITRGRCLVYRGIIETYFWEAGTLDVACAIETMNLAARLLETTDDAWGQALVLSQLGAHARRLREFERAEAVLSRASELARATGERYLIGSCLPKWGNLRVELGDLKGAERLFIEALTMFRELRDGWWAARCLHFLAHASARTNDYRRVALVMGAADVMLESCGARLNPPEYAVV
jgi:tetratricopeptide (TPR) repeat protein